MKFLTALVLITLIFGLTMTFGATIMERRDDKDVNNKDKDYDNHHKYYYGKDFDYDGKKSDNYDDNKDSDYDNKKDYKRMRRLVFGRGDKGQLFIFIRLTMS